MRHLEEKNVGYFEHMLNAFSFALYSIIATVIFFIGAVRYTIHAFVPPLFGNSTAEWMTKTQVKVSKRFRV